MGNVHKYLLQSAPCCSVTGCSPPLGGSGCPHTLVSPRPTQMLRLSPSCPFILHTAKTQGPVPSRDNVVALRHSTSAVAISLCIIPIEDAAKLSPGMQSKGVELRPRTSPNFNQQPSGSCPHCGMWLKQAALPFRVAKTGFCTHLWGQENRDKVLTAPHPFLWEARSSPDGHSCRDPPAEPRAPSVPPGLS